MRGRGREESVVTTESGTEMGMVTESEIEMMTTESEIEMMIEIEREGERTEEKTRVKREEKRRKRKEKMPRSRWKRACRRRLLKLLLLLSQLKNQITDTEHPLTHTPSRQTAETCYFYIRQIYFINLNSCVLL